MAKVWKHTVGKKEYKYTRAPFNSQFTRSNSSQPVWFVYDRVDGEWLYFGHFDTYHKVALAIGSAQ